MTTFTGARTAALSNGALFDEVPALAELDPADPYPSYARLFGPPVSVAGGDVVIVTRYADCEALLRHPDVTVRRSISPAFRGMTSAFFNLLDPPEHTRIRGLTNKAFTPRSIEALRPWLEDTTHELIDAAAATRSFDVVAALAYPLPLYAICQMLDIPPADRDTVMGWSKAISYGVDLLAGRRTREEQVAYRKAIGEFKHYVEDLTELRRAAPGDDMLTRLIQSEQTGDRLTQREISSTVIGLLISGHETTASLIGHGAKVLVARPDLRERVARDQAFADDFVEELVRFEPSVQAAMRVAARDLTVDGVDVAAGSALLLILAAANRDPDKFDDPDDFIVGRPDPRGHLAFGVGRHFCLGAALGRLEARIALTAMAQRLVNPRQHPGGVSYAKSVMLRNPTLLELDVDDVLPRQSMTEPSTGDQS